MRDLTHPHSKPDLVLLLPFFPSFIPSSVTFFFLHISSTFCHQTSSTCHTDTTTEWNMEWATPWHHPPPVTVLYCTVLYCTVMDPWVFKWTFLLPPPTLAHILSARLPVGLGQQCKLLYLLVCTALDLIVSVQYQNLDSVDYIFPWLTALGQSEKANFPV